MRRHAPRVSESNSSTLKDRVYIGGLAFTNKDPINLAHDVVSHYLRCAELLPLFAAHISTLNARTDLRFKQAFNESHAAYVDGISFLILSRLLGRPLKKKATTDMAPEILRLLALEIGRPCRVAVIGGSVEVNSAAAISLEADLPVEVVVRAHGYQSDWGPIVRLLKVVRPDVVIVGLGMPLEAHWVSAHRNGLPPAILMTCGGWLRLLAGVEQRSPSWMQRAQLEWLYRICTDPRRTFSRYFRGIGSILSVLISERKART